MITTTNESEQLRLRVAALEAELKDAYELKFPWSGNLGRWEWHYATGKVVYSDLKLAAIGFLPGEIDPKVYEWTARIHRDDYEHTMDCMKRHLMGLSPVYEVEYRILAKDQSYKWFYDRGRVTEYDSGGKPSVIAGIVFDITKSKQMEADLKSSLEFKNRLVAIISHDLRGPIGVTNNLLGNVELLEPEDYPPVFKAVSQTNQRVFALLENLLEWARINMERPVVERRAVSTAEIVKKQLALLGPVAAKKNLVLLHHPAGAYALADEVMLEVVVRNLLSNAIKFSPCHGTVELRESVAGDQVCLEVIDTGRGMTPDEIERLKAAKYHESKPGTAGETGTGLGLLLCREFLKLNKGSLLIASEPGKGSTFTIQLQREGATG
ncbi:MAG: PAS domain-containing sensor histidine kinase [Spirochaetales bacterium]